MEKSGNKYILNNHIYNYDYNININSSDIHSNYDKDRRFYSGLAFVGAAKQVMENGNRIVNGQQRNLLDDDLQMTQAQINQDILNRLAALEQ